MNKNIKPGAPSLTGERLRARIGDMRERLMRGPHWQDGDLDWLDMGAATDAARLEHERETQRAIWARNLRALVNYAERCGHGASD